MNFCPKVANGVPKVDGNDKKGLKVVQSKTLGERVLSKRRELKWSREVLAQKSDASPATIERIETGKYLPGLDTLEKLCNALEVRAAYLLGEEDMPPPDNETSRQTLQVVLRIESKLNTLIPPQETSSKIIPVKPIINYVRTKFPKKIPCSVLHIPSAIGAGGYHAQAWMGDMQDALQGKNGIKLRRTEVELPEKAEFSIYVKGSSMAPTIVDGALVYYYRTGVTDIRPDDMVIFLDGESEEFKLRRVHCQRKRGKEIMTLVPDNPECNDIRTVNDQTDIRGVVVYGDNSPPPENQ